MKIAIVHKRPTRKVTSAHQTPSGNRPKKKPAKTPSQPSEWQQKLTAKVQWLGEEKPELVSKVLRFKGTSFTCEDIAASVLREAPNLAKGLRPEVIREIFRLHGGRPKQARSQLRANARRAGNTPEAMARKATQDHSVVTGRTELGARHTRIREAAKGQPAEKLIDRAEALKAEIAGLRKRHGWQSTKANRPQIELNAIKRALKDKGITFE